MSKPAKGVISAPNATCLSYRHVLLFVILFRFISLVLRLVACEYMLR